jgi:hypothetical protein
MMNSPKAIKAFYTRLNDDGNGRGGLADFGIGLLGTNGIGWTGFDVAPPRA